MKSRGFGKLSDLPATASGYSMEPSTIYGLSGFRIRDVRAIIGGRIPNVFTRGSFTNAKLRVIRGSESRIIELPNGNYTASDISDYVNSQISSWWTDARDPGFKLELNRTTGLVALTIIHGKTSLPDRLFAVDFTVEESDFNLLIGFGKQMYNGEGITMGTDTPRLKWFGEYINVYLRSHLPNNLLCSIPVRDDGTMSPVSCVANLARDVQVLATTDLGALRLEGSTTGQEIVFMNADAIVCFNVMSR
jgi:hypothetical protein